MNRSALPVLAVVLAVFSLGCDQIPVSSRYADCRLAVDDVNAAHGTKMNQEKYAGMVYTCVRGYTSGIDVSADVYQR